MNARLASLRRLLALQAQRKRLAEWNLAALERRRAAIAVAERDLGAFVSAENLAGPLATVALAQARRLAERAAATEREREHLVTLRHAAERRHRLAERINDAAERDERAASGRRDLEQLLENFLGRHDPQP